MGTTWIIPNLGKTIKLDFNLNDLLRETAKREHTEQQAEHKAFNVIENLGKIRDSILEMKGSDVDVKDKQEDTKISRDYMNIKY